MMRKWITILGGLLIVQLVMAVTINLTGENYQAFQAEEKLLTFDVGRVDGLRIEGEGQTLVLHKRDGRWLLPVQDDFPADQQSVERLLDKLAGLEKGWPVATSVSAASRFKLAEDDYQLRLALLSNDQSLAELYVGTSPGFRKVHVRPEGDEAVYSVAFNTWEASPKADDWIDKQVLQFDKESVQRIELPGLVLQREGDALQVAGLSEQEQANSEEIEALLDKLAGLRIQSLLGTEAKPEYGQDASQRAIKLALNEGAPLSYRFSKTEGENHYVLKRSDLDYYFKLPEYTVTPILDATRDKLVVKAADEATSEASSETAAPSTALPDE